MTNVSKIEFLKFLHDEEYLDDLQSSLRTKHENISNAIDELSMGSRVVRLTISGKTTEFHQTDLSQLQTIRDEIANQLRTLFGIGRNRCYRVRSSKGL